MLLRKRAYYCDRLLSYNGMIYPSAISQYLSAVILIAQVLTVPASLAKLVAGIIAEPFPIPEVQ